MEISNKERVIFDDIQKKLFYMIPEKWDAIYLYASIVVITSEDLSDNFMS